MCFEHHNLRHSFSFDCNFINATKRKCSGMFHWLRKNTNSQRLCTLPWLPWRWQNKIKYTTPPSTCALLLLTFQRHEGRCGAQNRRYTNVLELLTELRANWWNNRHRHGHVNTCRHRNSVSLYLDPRLSPMLSGIMPRMHRRRITGTKAVFMRFTARSHSHVGY